MRVDELRALAHPPRGAELALREQAERRIYPRRHGVRQYVRDHGWMNPAGARRLGAWAVKEGALR